MVFTFIEVFHCTSVNGRQMHVEFTEVECYVGDYILFVILGIFFTVILSLYTIIMSLIYFECRFSSQDAFAKTSARGDALFIVFKLVLVFAFTFLVSDSLQIILVFIMVLGSLVLFNYFNFNVFYNDFRMSKIITSLHASLLWGSLMLILGVITQDHDFNATFFAFIIGLPFIVVIVLLRVEQRYDYLLLNSNNYESLSLAQTQLLYLNKLLGQYKSDRSVAILLDGFLDFHRTMCNKEDCPSKRRIMKTTKFSK